MKRIPLTQNKFALVDDCDFEYLMQWKWHYDNGYAKRKIHVNGSRKLKTVCVHNIVGQRMGLDLSYEVDHIHRTTLDNRRNNLRSATACQQMGNVSLRKDNKSGFRGVYWDQLRNKWAAYIRINKKAKWLGYHLTKKEAAKVYNNAATEHFGEFAWLNPI